MATNRRTGRQRPSDGPAAGRAGSRPDGRKKLTVYLAAELIRQLKHLAIDEDRDLGDLVAPKLRELVGQRYQVHRRAEPAPAPPADPAAAPEPLRIAAPEGLADAG